MNETAKGFLSRCFAPGDTLALLLRNESEAKTQQRIILADRALKPRYLGWLAHENHSGANIYVAANPLLTGSRKRTKECIASVRHLYIDIDVNGEARVKGGVKAGHCGGVKVGHFWHEKVLGIAGSMASGA